MATKTRATSRPTVAHAAETLPGALALLNGLDQVARSLVPFEAGDTSLALVVNPSSPLPFHAEHVAAFRGLATLAGVAAREDSHRAHLEELFMSVIVSLTMALEAKDAATEGHSVRVAAYSEAIGKELGLG